MAINFKIIESPTKTFAGSVAETTTVAELLGIYEINDGYLMTVSGEPVELTDTLAQLSDISENPELIEIALASKVKNAVRLAVKSIIALFRRVRSKSA